MAAFDFTARQVYQVLDGHRYRIFLLKDYLGGRQPLDLDAFEASQKYPFQAFNYVAAPG